MKQVPVITMVQSLLLNQIIENNDILSFTRSLLILNWYFVSVNFDGFRLEENPHPSMFGKGPEKDLFTHLAPNVS